MKKDNKEQNEIMEDDNKKGIIIILIAIVVVIGLIVLTAYLSRTTEENEPKEEDIKAQIKVDEDLSENVSDSKVVTVSSKKYKVRYLDIDGNQLGKTQRVSSLDDRKNEKAPKIDGMRFVEWVLDYNEEDNVYYYIASYRENVETIAEEVKVSYKSSSTHTSNVTPVEDEETENKVYDVEIEGEISEIEEIEEDVTISEEYKHILVLRFYAPEEVTKENIENMKVTVHPTEETVSIDKNQYSLNAEDEELTGRELLDSTDEEYENNIFYFDYYQETDTKTNTTIEVYWGNDPDANETTEPKEKYIEVYNIELDAVENKEEAKEEE